MTDPVVLVDTNVLVAVVDEGRASHDAALDVWEDDPRRLAVSAQVAREFLACVTRPHAANGLGMSGTVAVSVLRSLLDGMELLPAHVHGLPRLQELVAAGLATGKQIHDAHLVATALAHDVRILMTDNVRHFSRYADLIEIESLT